MLYDQRWDAKTKADPFSLESLIAWLEKQPADGVYCYMDTGSCLLGRYFTEMGFKEVNVGSDDFAHAGSLDRTQFSFGDIAVEKPHTYGAALERAQALTR